MSDLIVPDQQKPEGKKALLVPITKELEGQALSILRNNALSLIVPKLLIVDEKRMAEEESVNQPGSGVYVYDKKGVFGLPVFDTITLNSLTYTDFEDKEVSLGNFTLDIALVEVYNDRNIICTPIMGRNGTIKEYMSDGDYAIKITGSLINPLANIPPEQLIRALNGFCKAQTEIKVNSTVLSYLDIFTIVIMRPKFIQRKGERNAIDYELECLSETPFELK